MMRPLKWLLILTFTAVSLFTPGIPDLAPYSGLSFRPEHTIFPSRKSYLHLVPS